VVGRLQRSVVEFVDKVSRTEPGLFAGDQEGVDLLAVLKQIPVEFLIQLRIPGQRLLQQVLQRDDIGIALNGMALKCLFGVDR
jgi:hypothetical protein